MEFGVFDHLDRSDLPLHEFYEARLKLIEGYDRAGFHAYHVAEHHSTPLGMAPSPSVFLAAAMQRTKTLRRGTLVYALPLHHPLRMIEEICMLDHLSGGRFDMGFGRGSSPIELEYYGQNPEDAPRAFAEALDIVLRGLKEKVLNGETRSRRFRDVPMELTPLQRPHPPLWYGVHSTESAERAARLGFSIACNEPADVRRRISRAIGRPGEKRMAAKRRRQSGCHPICRGGGKRCGCAGNRSPRLSGLAPKLPLSVPPAWPDGKNQRWGIRFRSCFTQLGKVSLERPARCLNS